MNKELNSMSTDLNSYFKTLIGFLKDHETELYVDESLRLLLNDTQYLAVKSYDDKIIIK